MEGSSTVPPQLARGTGTDGAGLTEQRITFGRIIWVDTICVYGVDGTFAVLITLSWLTVLS